jgi:hypothetical protein
VRFLAISAIALAYPCLAWGQEDADLARIPDVAPATLPADRDAQVVFLEAVAIDGIDRAPFDSPRAGRLFLDLRLSGETTSEMRWTLSNRTSLNFVQDQPVSWSGQSVRNDVREAYLSWRPTGASYLDVGRINVRGGIALGYQPTDLLAAGSAVPQASDDPTAAREGRLGVAMVRYQALWTAAALSVIYAPRLAEPRHQGEPGPLALRLDRTSVEDRWLVTATFSHAPLSPQVTAALIGDRPVLAISGSHLVGSSVVLYGEWSLTRDPTLLGLAGAGAEPARWGDQGRRTIQRATLGASWANALLRTSVNLEYHYNGAGVAGSEWSRYWRSYDDSDDPVARRARAIAADRQEPLGTHEAFLRVQLDDMPSLGFTLVGFSVVNLHDGSRFSQGSVTYDVDRHWTAAFHLTLTAGKADSEFGSLPRRFAATLQLQRYF